MYCLNKFFISIKTNFKFFALKNKFFNLAKKIYKNFYEASNKIYKFFVEVAKKILKIFFANNIKQQTRKSGRVRMRLTREG